MPWLPELFTAPALTRIWEDERRRQLALVPFFAGVMTGEIGALVDSFAGEPELHHPVRGRIKGVAAFEHWVRETRAWLAERAGTAEDVDFVIAGGCGVEETLLRLDGGIELPVAIATDHDDRGRLVEQRMYFSSRPLTGGHAIRPPVLQPSAEVQTRDVVGEYQRALAAGDADGVLAALAPDATVREAAGGAHTHRGTDELRVLYERCFANGGGIALEHCALTDDGRGCALEYNVVAWGRTALPPQAGLTVYVRDPAARLAAVRIYHDAGPPPSAEPALSRSAQENLQSHP